ncbi:MAG TPA: M15 family metallopeptidase [Polyangiaceae bacterium]
MWVAKLRLGLVILGLSSCRRTGVVEHVVPSAPAASAEPVVAEPPLVAAVPFARPPISNCAPQTAQEFLVDAHLRAKNLQSAPAQLEWWALLQRSIRYRTEQYGYYKDFGLRSWNPRSLQSQMRVAKFMGLPVVLHERVIPALRCVELALERDCVEQPYRPRTLAGLRQTNTYFGGDVTNHVYGIALDIDPSVNPCCNCVEPWRSNPRCRGAKSDFERMAMPRCWVTVFEQYGFYWLGHDELKDTMHFEFLGDPNKISSSAP